MAPKKIKRKATAEPKETEVVEEKPTQEKGSDYESDEVRKICSTRVPVCFACRNIEFF